MSKRHLKWYNLRLNPLSASRAKPGKRPQICVGILYAPISLGRQTFSAINNRVARVFTEFEEALSDGVDACVARALGIAPQSNVTEDLVSTRYRFVETYLFSFSKIFRRTLGKFSFFKCMKMLWLCITRSLLHFLLPGELCYARVHCSVNIHASILIATLF